tara:strand:- start:12 stop:275 length:264 start_codon:yes stop_codon:yes gene_type:complete
MAYFLFSINTGGVDEMKQADLSSQCNGITQSFTVPEDYQAGSLRVYYNGVRQVEGETFTEYNNTTFQTTGFTPQTGDYLTIDYAQST